LVRYPSEFRRLERQLQQKQKLKHENAAKKKTTLEQQQQQIQQMETKL
jgi:hypothetical protein